MCAPKVEWKHLVLAIQYIVLTQLPKYFPGLLHLVFTGDIFLLSGASRTQCGIADTISHKSLAPPWFLKRISLQPEITFATVSLYKLFSNLLPPIIPGIFQSDCFVSISFHYVKWFLFRFQIVELLKVNKVFSLPFFIIMLHLKHFLWELNNALQLIRVKKVHIFLSNMY